MFFQHLLGTDLSVCIINLVDLDPASNGGLSRVACEFSRTIFDLSVEYPALHPVFAVQAAFAPQFTRWLQRPAVVIPVNSENPRRPLLQGLNPDILISPLIGIEPFDQIKEFESVRHIAVMPDTLALDLPQTFSEDTLAQRHKSYQLLKNAYHIITLSGFARLQILHRLHLPAEAVTAIPLGADSIQNDGTASETFNLSKPYLFYPANTWRHKRHELAFQVLSQVLRQRPEFHLVLTGGRVANFGVDLAKLAESHQIPADRIIDLGYVTDAELPPLYQNAEALLFTSCYEGFGMAIVEAMRLGCPVVCAPLTALPEVAGDAALYVDSDSPQDWARAILHDLPVQREALIEQGKQRAAQFSWQKTRKRYRELLLATAPDVFGPQANVNRPAVLLEPVLQELEPRYAPLVTEPPASEVDVSGYIQYMGYLLNREKNIPFAHVPIIGLGLRALVRLRNLGRFWRASSIIARELMWRQAKLAREIEEKLIE